MKLFISWSGDISLEFATVLKGWLQDVIQAVTPFMSTTDIRAGIPWFSEIGKQLDKTDFGILCITPDNVTAPWLLFEAGALSKKVEKSHVCPLLLGMSKSQLTPPLSQFQAKEATEADVFHLMTTINSTLEENRLSDGRLKSAFDRVWPDLDQTITKISEKLAAPQAHGKSAARSSDEMLEELLGLTRSIARTVDAGAGLFEDISRKNEWLDTLARSSPQTAGNPLTDLVKQGLFDGTLRRKAKTIVEPTKKAVPDKGKK